MCNMRAVQISSQLAAGSSRTCISRNSSLPTPLQLLHRQYAVFEDDPGILVRRPAEVRAVDLPSVHALSQSGLASISSRLDLANPCTDGRSFAVMGGMSAPPAHDLRPDAAGWKQISGWMSARALRNG